MKAFLVSFLLFVVLDIIWLGFVMKDFNMRQLMQIGRIREGSFDVLLSAALVVYVFMSLLIVYFVIPRVGADESLVKTFAVGALAGLLVYGIFDMTNLAILKDYPLLFALVDMAWGTALFGAVTVIVKQVGT